MCPTQWSTEGHTQPPHPPDPTHPTNPTSRRDPPHDPARPSLRRTQCPSRTNAGPDRAPTGHSPNAPRAAARATQPTADVRPHTRSNAGQDADRRRPADTKRLRGQRHRRCPPPHSATRSEPPDQLPISRLAGHVRVDQQDACVASGVVPVAVTSAVMIHWSWTVGSGSGSSTRGSLGRSVSPREQLGATADQRSPPRRAGQHDLAVYPPVHRSACCRARRDRRARACRRAGAVRRARSTRRTDDRGRAGRTLRTRRTLRTDEALVTATAAGPPVGPVGAGPCGPVAPTAPADRTTGATGATLRHRSDPAAPLRPVLPGGPVPPVPTGATGGTGRTLIGPVGTDADRSPRPRRCRQPRHVALRGRDRRQRAAGR